MDRRDTAMEQVTWESVEAIGTPPSRMRGILFDLGRFIDSRPDGDQLAPGSAAYTALTKEIHEQHPLKSALQL